MSVEDGYKLICQTAVGTLMSVLENDEAEVKSKREVRHPSAVANTIVSLAKDSTGVDLDYSMDSLAVIERLLPKLKQTADEDEVLLGLGCYLGETLIRNGGGQWIHDETLIEQLKSPVGR